MTDVRDIELMVANARSWILADNGIAAGIRTFDGSAELMIEVIRELRRLNDNLERRPPSDA